jgi:hypothetical protein
MNTITTHSSLVSQKASVFHTLHMFANLRINMQLSCSAGLLAVTVACLHHVVAQSAFSVPPFDRYLSLKVPSLNGRDVTTLQNLLRNPPFASSLPADGTFGPSTASALKSFQQSINLPSDGIMGPQTATALLKFQMFDGYILRNVTAASMGYKYMVRQVMQCTSFASSCN